MEDRCECGCRQIWSDKHHMLLCLHCDLGRKPKKHDPGPGHFPLPEIRLV
jgi:hypothetical protein